MVSGWQLGLVCISGCTTWFKGCSVFFIYIFGPIRVEGTENQVRRGDVLHFEVSGIVCSRFISSQVPIFLPVSGVKRQIAAEASDHGKGCSSTCFLLSFWSAASYWPPLSSFLIRKSPNGWKMASKRTSRSISPSHQSQEPRLSQAMRYLPGDDPLGPFMLNVLEQTRKLHRLELWGLGARGTQTSG